MTAPTDSSVSTKVLSIDYTFFVFSFIFIIIIIIIIVANCNDESLFITGIKIKIFLFFTIIYPKINIIVVKAICLGNNLPMHIRENAGFPWQKPQQLPSVKASFVGWAG